MSIKKTSLEVLLIKSTCMDMMSEIVWMVHDIDKAETRDKQAIT